MTGAVEPPLGLKPRLRGVSHQWAFFVSLALGVVLVLSAPSGRAAWAAAVYSTCVALLFGTSALWAGDHAFAADLGIDRQSLNQSTAGSSTTGCGGGDGDGGGGGGGGCGGGCGG